MREVLKKYDEYFVQNKKPTKKFTDLQLRWQQLKTLNQLIKKPNYYAYMVTSFDLNFFLGDYGANNDWKQKITPLTMKRYFI